MKATAEANGFGVQRAGWEILAAPRMVAWVGNEIELSDPEKVALLRRDVYLVDLPVLRENGAPWLRPWSHAYAINFDQVKRYKNRFRAHDDLVVATDLCRKIASIRGASCIIHGTEPNAEVAELFEKNNLRFIANPVTTKGELISFLRHHILPLITGPDRKEREAVRLRLGSGVRILVAISTRRDGAKYAPIQVLRGALSDVSPLGIGINLFHKSGTRTLRMGQAASIQLAWQSSGITVKKAIITRIDKNTGTVGLSFNLENSSCLDEQDAFRFGKFIGDQIKIAMQSEFQFARYALS